MHTTRILAAADFAYARIGDGERLPAAFADLFPDWHERERVAVVSRTVEEGIVGTGATLLALATRFYDAQREKARERGGAFFDYPRHFALIGGPQGDVVHAAGGDRPFAEPVLRRSWGQLDVWPPTNWLVESPTATAMLGRAYAMQIDRLLWPAGLRAAPSAPRLTALARRLLQSRLKQVLLYGADRPDATVEASPAARDLVAGALTALGTTSVPEADRLRRVAVDEFLATMGSCFADDEAARV